ncbi:MAG: Gfo/Idh/MocA family oxidoreductase, partial [Fimbriimonadaceae bacterium]|nr:Gfo/Idh/MocA family oxidoreductase [Fimbriimonadaceae bacterium]
MATKSKKLKIGLIGTGGIARGCHIPGYLSMPDDCEIVAACDIDLELAQKVAKEHGIAKATSDYKEILADKEIDAVSITTPNKFHMGPTIDALKAGKHVLCEKPLAMNGEECRAMCRTAKDTGKILQVALQNRFTGQARFLKDYIDKGHMGDIYYARATALRRRGVPGWGVFIDKEKQGGGPLIDIGVHILDLTLHMMGYPKPVAASGKTWDMLGKDPSLYNGFGDYDRSKFTVEDFAVGLIRFDNGAIVVLESSFMANNEGETWSSNIYGTKAGATMKPWGDNPLTIYTEVDQQLFDLRPRNIPDVKSAHTAEVQAFVKAIQNGDPSPVPGEEGLILNSIFDAIDKRSETGKEEL